MSEFGKLSEEEVERRRLASVESMRRRDREDFDKWYQAECDRMYWARGQCCAGCDHWQSDMARTGRCQAGGIVSGHDVMMSITGGGFSSYTPPPGYPYRPDDHWCSLFKDDFDWSTLDPEYLRSVGAMRNGELRDKPSHPPAQRR